MPVSDAIREPKKGVFMPAAGRKTCNNQLEVMQQVRRGQGTATHRLYNFARLPMKSGIVPLSILL